MAFDLELAERIRLALRNRVAWTERRMFGGLGIMVGGHMLVALVAESLMVRVGPAAYEQALAEPYVGPMDLTGKPLRGWVLVDPDGLQTSEQLQRWLDVALAVVLALPPK